MNFNVVIPTYNSARTIERCLNSLLHQTRLPASLFIVDGKSTDDTVDMCKRLLIDVPFHWKISSESDEGISDAFNKGINLCSDGWIHILGSDDWYSSSTSLEEINQVCRDVRPSVLFFSALLQGPNSNLSTRTPKLSCRGFLAGMTVIHPAAIVHSSIYKQCGGFNLNYKTAMDFEWLLRVQKKLGPATFFLCKPTIVSVGYGGESVVNKKRGYQEVLSAQILYSNAGTLGFVAQYYLKVFLFTTAFGVFLWRFIRPIYRIFRR